MVVSLQLNLTTNQFFLFSEKKDIPHMASARIQRWALTLSAYQYTIRHKSGTEI